MGLPPLLHLGVGKKPGQRFAAVLRTQPWGAGRCAAPSPRSPPARRALAPPQHGARAALPPPGPDRPRAPAACGALATLGVESRVMGRNGWAGGGRGSASAEQG